MSNNPSAKIKQFLANLLKKIVLNINGNIGKDFGAFDISQNIGLIPLLNAKKYQG